MNVQIHALPLLIGVLCVYAIAYRYYSAFLAAKVAVLDDTRETPATRLRDGHNYHPTHKWVLFGHHFAAISGAGPLVGPVLAAQFGYLPGLLWLVIGVVLAGAVQDFLVLAFRCGATGARWPRSRASRSGRWPA
jgi:carbon starvation protein